MGRRTIDALLDSAPAGMEDRVLAVVEKVPGVRNCHNLRIRYSGPVLFIDLHVLVDAASVVGKHVNGRLCNLLAWSTVAFSVLLSSAYLAISM